jgi:hypothetical protein
VSFDAYGPSDVAQGRKECERLPMPVRRLSTQVLSSRFQPWVRTMLALAQVSSMKTQSMVHEWQGGVSENFR